jgi:hypothetical protein
VKKTHRKPYNNINCLFNGTAATIPEQHEIKAAKAAFAVPLPKVRMGSSQGSLA